MSERLMTVKDYAKLKGVTEETVRRWIRAGLIPPYQVDRMGKRGHIRIKVTAAA